MPRLLLARHGETAWNRERRVQGWAPVGLTETGREQARRLGRHLAAEYDVDRVRCSDLRRAIETARLAVRELDLEDRERFDRNSANADDAPPVRDPAWRERDFGVLQGLTRDALFDGHPEFAVDQTGHAAVPATPEGGESLLDLRDRVLRAADGLLADLEADETVLVVTHGGPLRLVLGAALGLDVVAAISELEPPNCSVTELAVADGAPLSGDGGSDGNGSHGDASESGASDGGESRAGPCDGDPCGGDANEGGEYDPRFPEAITVDRHAAARFLDLAAD